MKKIFFVISIFCLLFTGCITLPQSSLYVENIAVQRETVTTGTSSGAVYSVDYCFAEKEKYDFISFKINTLLNEYRLDFSANGNIKTVLQDFFKIDNPSPEGHKKDGEESLGSSPLYCYAVSGEDYIRLDVAGKTQDNVDFSIVSKNDMRTLVLNGFTVKTLRGPKTVDRYVESISFRYEDIKKLYDFMSDAENLNRIRAEKLQEREEEAAQVKAETKEVKEEKTELPKQETPLN